MMVKVGDKVRVVMNTSGHDFELGEIVVLHESDSQGWDFRAYYPDGSNYWYVDETDVAPIIHMPATPSEAIKEQFEHHMGRGECVRALKWARLAEQAKELENESP